MSIVLYHNPHSRAATVVGMLEELDQPYTLRFVDFRTQAHKQEEHLRRNRMGKLPVLEDGEVVISETAAIGVYLADRYSLGGLAPALDDPDRGAYLRWCFYSPSVIEPACAANSSGWEYRASAVGWGRYEDMLDTVEGGIGEGPWLLGDRFSMADVILGSTLRWMLMFDMMDKRPTFTDYVERFGARPAQQAAAARNAAVVKEQGLGG